MAKIRQKILKKTRIFIARLPKNFIIINCVISVDCFFNKTNLYNFVKTIKCANSGINLVLIHLSEMSKFISINLEKNLYTAAKSKDNFSLKKYQLFQNLLEPKLKSLPKKVPVFDNYQVKDFILNHAKKHSFSSQCVDPIECRISFMLLSGLRFQSTLDLNQNSEYLAKVCQHCKNLPACNNVTIACLNRIKIFETKTYEHNLPLLDQIQKCYWQLLYDDNNATKNYANLLDDTNKFCQKTFSCTSHGLRKFLPNFMNAAAFLCNTGNWSNNNTMKNHYLHDDIKYTMVLSFLRDSG